MRVLLLQLDGKLPNVALMRIAAHHRERGDLVEFKQAQNEASLGLDLWDATPDRVYASLIFTRTRTLAKKLLALRPDAVVGGTGWDMRSSLEAHGITTLTQDYSIFPTFKPSIGFTQRGCRMNEKTCPFCVVPKKEGKVRGENTIASLWRGDPWPRKLLLLDNDFFGQPGWRDRVREINDGGFQVCFSQGINARMLNAESAEAMASMDVRDDAFKDRRIYTAWDNRGDERTLFRGLECLKAAGFKPDHVMVYMLVGYWPGETAEDRLYRHDKLREWGARPYPMPYRHDDEIAAHDRSARFGCSDCAAEAARLRALDTETRGLLRWCAGAYDKRIPWPAWAAARYQPRNLGGAA